MYGVCVTGFFSAIHVLEGDVPAHEKIPHAHNYKLEWSLEIASLDERGFSMDISLLEDLRDSFIVEIEGVNLNDHEYFCGKPVSLENLSDFVFKTLYTGLVQRVEASDMCRIEGMEIRIWENDHAWAGIKRTGEGFAR